MEKMLYKYGEEAKDAGVYIVSACGFDSIPNDLGVLLMEKKFPGELAYVESYMTTENVSLQLSNSPVAYVAREAINCSHWDKWLGEQKSLLNRV